MTNNIYHHYLNIPVEFELPSLDTVNTDRLITYYNLDQVDPRLISWLDTLNIVVLQLEVFYLHPDKMSCHNPHTDGQCFDNHTKINFVFTDCTTYMNWYEPTIDSALTLKSGSTNGVIRGNREELKLMYSVEMNKPSLVNVGVLHDVYPPVTSPRYCFCLVLGHKLDAGHLKISNPQFGVNFQDAEIIFKDYII
jgi:hypothetical protein